MNTDGTNGHWASPTPAFTSLSAAAWSPDGTRILAHSSTEGLMSINVATGALTHVTNNGANVAGLFPSFNPAGTKIVFDAPGGSVGIMNADGTGSITTIKRPSGDNVEFPSFSPDASKILLTVGTVGARDADIYVLAGSTFTLVTSHGASHSASWAPDGKQIAFYTPQFNIARMAPDGSGRVRLTSSGTDFSPAYSH
jgi:Tol biopolymer transport system component